MNAAPVLLDRLRRAGIDAVRVDEAAEGMAALAGIATRRSGQAVFAKTFLDPPGDDIFSAEAEGLSALRELGGMTTPDVILTTRELLVLGALRPRPDDPAFWERLAHAVARMHTTTVADRFGWHRDNWLGQARQDNTWHDDGHAFFAQRRVLRWLAEPRVRAALDPTDRTALERLCERLTELLPPRPACLTHGDLWVQNVIATPAGEPAVIDPAVSYTWAEVDLSMLWCSPRPAAADRFFAVYAELTGLDDGWQARLPLLHLRQHLAVVAQFDYDWGAAETIRALVAPFRRRPVR
jgi:fructosamine-3-kinase